MCIINITNRRFFGSGVIFRTFIRRIRNENKQKHTKKNKIANSLDLKRNSIQQVTWKSQYESFKQISANTRIYKPQNIELYCYADRSVSSYNLNFWHPNFYFKLYISSSPLPTRNF